MSSITDQATSPIIKSDRTGRTRYTAQFKRDVLAAFESSSLSAPVFAKQCGIKYPTFAAWIAVGKRPQPISSSGQPAFLIAELAAPSDGTAFEVHLPGGAVARVSSSEQVRLLAELLRHLA
jgi:hypothetical protein